MTMAGTELVRQKISIDKRGRAWGVQCQSPRHDGQPCTRWAIRGGTVCAKHGGQLPVVRAAANARLRTLAELAVDSLSELATSPQVDAGVRLRAVKLILRLNRISDTLPERQRGRQSATHRALEAGPTVRGELDGEIDALLAQVVESNLPSGAGAGAP